MPNAKLEAKVDRYSFFVRLLPPLLHTGLARRTNIAISLTIICPTRTEPSPQAVQLLRNDAQERSTVNQISAKYLLDPPVVNLPHDADNPGQLGQKRLKITQFHWVVLHQVFLYARILRQTG
jgi:hypothetical protein